MVFVQVLQMTHLNTTEIILLPKKKKELEKSKSTTDSGSFCPRCSYANVVT